MLSRSAAANGLLRLSANARYLEIGVNRGDTFFAVQAQRKVAVDPKFAFEVVQARDAYPNAAFWEMTSDEYFAEKHSPNERFDVIYLDGLHTFEQTLRDFTNSINVLAPRGIILIDDVVPTTYHSALSSHVDAVKVKAFTSSQDDSWMGDTYKLVFFIATFFPSYNFRTIADNHGQAVVWRAPRIRQNIEPMSVEKIARLTFLDVVDGMTAFRKETFANILQEVATDLESLSNG